MWLGYQQSLRPCQAGLMLNIDTAATAFLEDQPMTQYLMRSLVYTCCMMPDHQHLRS